MTIRIAIGCHSYVLGEGLKKLFKDDEGTDIIGIFDEGIDLKEIIKLGPDIILADLKIFRTFPESVPTDNVKDPAHQRRFVDIRGREAIARIAVKGSVRNPSARCRQ